ncbi:MAG TPA: FtsX-like permease family protein, partial [Gemmatimonadales bacterium]|nr:FtsX-like permease family protein [Gemmatimonadales bacterium]
AGQRLVLMDIAQAQGLLNAAGGLSQIDLKARPGVHIPALSQRLQRALGPTVDVLTPERRRDRAEGLLAAFRLNLSALSLISLFVGLFLVYSAMQASLVRRRAEFGLLRSLGATRAQVFLLIAAEVVVLGALGVALGLPIGYWVAHANVRMVSATLTNLYLLHEIETLTLSPGLYVLAAVVGVGGALLGALGPALDVSRSDTKTLLAPFTLHEKLRTIARPLFVAGLAILILAGAWYWTLGRGWRPAGFALAVALVIALPLLTPLVVRTVSALAQVRRFGFGYSLRSLGVRLQTTAVAVAALGVAVAMLVGITFMIGSFRSTLDVWVNSTLRADVYITTPSWRGTGTAAALDSNVARRLANVPGVMAVDRLRGFPAYVGGRRVALAGVEMGLPGGERRFPLVQGDPATAFRAAQRGAVLISEPLARKTGRWTGDSLPLYTAHGLEHFPISGVYYDYSSENGTVIMDLATLRHAFGPGAINSMALYLAPGADVEHTVDRLKAEFQGVPLVIRSNRTLRRQVFRVFNETFAVTRILQAMGLLIAVCGITLTLLVLARERVSELALYRALGAGRRQIFRIFVGEGLGIGVLGLVLGAVGGILLAGVLIFIINRAYFGWTIQIALPAEALAGQATTILLAAVAASVYPAFKASRVGAGELAREDV